MSDQPDLTVLALGAGVQSSCLALMMVAGEIPPADVAIFADTQAEPGYVYQWLDYLTDQAAGIGMPVERVTAGSIITEIEDFAAAGGPERLSIPAFVAGADGRGAPLRRECTRTFKIAPQNRRICELLGGQVRGKHVHQLFGISYDEIVRMRTSRVRYIENVYPLVDARMTREDCLTWLREHGHPAPEKSACVCCPYRDARGWTALKRQHPAEFARAVTLDHALRRGQVRGVNKPVFTHRSLRPLDEIDFAALAGDPEAVDPGFVEECDGLCGH